MVDQGVHLGVFVVFGCVVGLDVMETVGEFLVDAVCVCVGDNSNSVTLVGSTIELVQATIPAAIMLTKVKMMSISLK